MGNSVRQPFGYLCSPSRNPAHCQEWGRESRGLELVSIAIWTVFALATGPWQNTDYLRQRGFYGACCEAGLDWKQRRKTEKLVERTKIQTLRPAAFLCVDAHRAGNEPEANSKADGSRRYKNDTEYLRPPDRASQKREPERWGAPVDFAESHVANLWQERNNHKKSMA